VLLTFEELPDESCDCTVSALEHIPAATVTAVLVNTSLEAEPATTKNVAVLEPPASCPVQFVFEKALTVQVPAMVIKEPENVALPVALPLEPVPFTEVQITWAFDGLSSCNEN